jgi:hypothetical protein
METVLSHESVAVTLGISDVLVDKLQEVSVKEDVAPVTNVSDGGEVSLRLKV